MNVQQVVGIGAGVVHHLGAEGAHPPVGQLVPLVSLEGEGGGGEGGYIGRVLRVGASLELFWS